MKLKDKDMENIIKISAKNKWTIVTENLLKADDIYKKAKEMKLKIPCPKTFYELEHTRIKGVKKIIVYDTKTIIILR